MKLLEYLFEFKDNIPSVCDIHLGESYDDLHDVISSVQERCTGDWRFDHYLEEYSVFVDVTPDPDGEISEIRITYYPYQPFDEGDMSKIVIFFQKHFEFAKYEEHIVVDGEEYSYDYECANDDYAISVHKDSDSSLLEIKVTTARNKVV